MFFNLPDDILCKTLCSLEPTHPISELTNKINDFSIHEGSVKLEIDASYDSLQHVPFEFKKRAVAKHNNLLRYYSELEGHLRDLKMKLHDMWHLPDIQSPIPVQMIDKSDKTRIKPLNRQILSSLSNVKMYSSPSGSINIE